MIDSDGFLMIEPTGYNEPIIDSLTRKTMALIAKHMEGTGVAFRGFHICSCGAVSDNNEWVLVYKQKQYPTNNLAVHYVACHRNELPLSDVELIAGFSEEKEPDNYFINGLRRGLNG